MTIDTQYLQRCVDTLAMAYNELNNKQSDELLYDIYRAACVKEFELVLEQSGKLLKKRLADFFATNKEVDRLVFKDLFRYAVKHDLISMEACERWLKYRDNRNHTAHDYGEKFAETTLQLLPSFIRDATDLINIINDGHS